MSKLTNEKTNSLNEEVEIESADQVELTEDQAVLNEEQISDETAVDPGEEYIKQIQVLKDKLEEADNRYLRLQADFDNFRRRTRLDLEASEKYRAQKTYY